MGDQGEFVESDESVEPVEPVDHVALRVLGWDEWFEAAWHDIGAPGAPARVRRVDRGWSSLFADRESSRPLRVRNLGADVAVGDWVVPSADDERAEHVL